MCADEIYCNWENHTAEQEDANLLLHCQNRQAELSPLTGTLHGLVRLLPIGALFARGSDIVCPSFFQYLLGLRGPVGTVGVNGQKNSPLFDPTFITLGFVFGNCPCQLKLP